MSGSSNYSGVKASNGCGGAQGMQREEICGLLKGMDSLKDVSEEFIKEMSRKASVSIFKKDEILFLESERIECIYIIGSGKAVVSKFSEVGEEKIIHVLHKGNFINEISIDGKGTSTSVVIMEDSQLLCFHKKDVIM